MTNEVLKTMIRQLKSQGVNLRNKDLLKVDENTLRVQQKVRTRMKRKKGADISYDKGMDLYNVKTFDVNLNPQSSEFGETKRKNYEGMFWDNLKDLIKF